MESPTDQQKSPMDYEAFLVDLKARRAAIDQTIQGVEQILGIRPSPSGSPSPNAPNATETVIRADSFFNLTIVDAVKKYLSMSKQPRSLKDILAALDAGGFVHDSANFYATVHSSLLRREKQGKDVIRVKRKWALTDWYPNKRQPAG